MNSSNTISPDIETLRSEDHVWLVNPDTVTDPERLAACQALLSTEETGRQSRFHFAEDRHRYLVSHALVRRVLSRYWPIPPQQWRFLPGNRGRPEIANPDVPALRFNLTHTRELAACIVSLGDDCGIDAEYLTVRHNHEGIAKRMFSAAEQTRLRMTGEDARLEHFYASWTLREAYVKARGIGMSFPVHKLQFSITSSHAVHIEFHPDIDDDAAAWGFRLFRPTAMHVLATASRSRRPAGKVVRLREYEF
jgi:4'-phosphopantetheinyl transferase